MKRTEKLSEIAEKWGMSVEELISYWEKKEPEYGAKLQRLVRVHEDQRSGGLLNRREEGKQWQRV